MSYGPPPEPNASAPQPDAAAADSQNGGFATAQPQGARPPYPHPHQPWSNPSGPGWPAWPGGPSPAGPRKGFGLPLITAILGLVGLVLPFFPWDFAHFAPDALNMRAYIALPFALPGFALAIVSLNQRRRGLPLAVVGLTSSALALLVELIMAINFATT